MSELRPLRLRLQRMSLGKTQPLVGVLLAAVLVVLCLGASTFAQQIRADRYGEERTATFARLIAAKLDTAEFPELIETLDILSDDRFVLLDGEGAVIGGNPAIIDLPGNKSATIQRNGELIAVLQTNDLMVFSFVLPWQLIFAMIVITLLAAYVVSLVITRYVVAGVNAVGDVVRDGPSKSAASVVTFSELQLLRIQVERRWREANRNAEKLAQAAYENPESGLPSLRAFFENVEGKLDQVDFEQPLCVLVLDLDNFRVVLEQFGPSQAKTLVRLTKARIEKELKALERSGLLQVSQCLLAHSAGDEFALVLPRGVGRATAGQVARNIRRAFVTPILVNGQRVTIGLSGGLAVAPEDGDTVYQLHQNARAALHGLRDRRKEGFAFYQARLDRLVENRVSMESALREALERSDFNPSFQPKIDLQTGEISGCEALARWTKPDGTAVSPAEFIPVAEQSGLIVDVGQAVLVKACAAAARWVKDGVHLPVAVNVSPAQLDDPGFCDRVLDAITSAGLPPKYLELEITESMAVSDTSHVRAVLHPLRRMGVSLAIDDFGTGHSNLATLSRLNFDVFKIDRSFVTQLDRDASAPAIVEMILAMAKSIGLKTVAEGVETRAQADFLRARGCAYAQGFLYSGALPEPAFRAFEDSWEPDIAKGELRKSA